MKKLLLLLILCFFSTQGFPASCPDGSEPTKTVSADGTYYVYKCAKTGMHLELEKLSDRDLILKAIDSGNANKIEFGGSQALDPNVPSYEKELANREELIEALEGLSEVLV